MNTYKKPAMAIHPGEILKDELDAREWTQKEFARIIGRPEKTISAIIKGKKEITPETAIEIAEALGTSPELWNGMQANYSLQTASISTEHKKLIQRRVRDFLSLQKRAKLRRNRQAFYGHKNACRSAFR